jgi:hypothetical protein
MGMDCKMREARASGAAGCSARPAQAMQTNSPPSSQTRWSEVEVRPIYTIATKRYGPGWPSGSSLKSHDNR